MMHDMVQVQAGGHFIVGGVYWNSEEELPFTVTELRVRLIDQELFVTTADLDYPCYGQVERVRRYPTYDNSFELNFPPLWEPAEDAAL
jgi:hypothetical protein